MDEYRDHFPAVSDDAKNATRDIYAETRRSYERLFGEIDERFWPASQDTCSDYSATASPAHNDAR